MKVLHWYWRYCSFCVSSMSRFFQHSVTEFRPDLFAGIVGGFAILLVVSEPAFLMTRKRQLYLGLLFGLALLAKPSAFLATGFFIAAAILFSYSGFLWERKLSVTQQLVPILRSFAAFALGSRRCFRSIPDSGRGGDLFLYVFGAVHLCRYQCISRHTGAAVQLLCHRAGGRTRAWVLVLARNCNNASSLRRRSRCCARTSPHALCVLCEPFGDARGARVDGRKVILPLELHVLPRHFPFS